MHKAKACVVTCIDFRFQKKIQDLLKLKGYIGVCDQISVAGASRDFIKPVKKEDGEYAWKQLEMSIKLHHPDEIIFIDHQDCGGYAQDGTIPGGLSKDEDKKAHTGFSKKLFKKLHLKFPEKKVRFYYAELGAGIEDVAVC